MPKQLLLEGSSDSEVDIHLNKDYAERYDKWRHKEELQKLKDRYGDVDDSSSSSESEDDEPPEIEKDFLKTLSLLKSKDPVIYDKNVTFFNETEENEKIPKKKKEKPLFLKEYEIKQALKEQNESSDENESFMKTKSSSYDNDKNEKEIKDSLKAALDDTDDEEDFIKARKKTKTEEEQEEADYLLWLKGEKELGKNDNSRKELKFLHDFWNDPKLDEDENFLKDYILNKKYVEKTKHNIPSYEEIVNDYEDLSDDEKTLEKQETFEHKYNFRFEEPDPEFIKQYPRTISDSMRRKDDRRKRKREEYQERKWLEKEQKKEELKRFKALKRKEIEDKLAKLKEITGNQHFGFEGDDIQGDFDPEKYDQRMKTLFDEEYYNIEEDAQKPVFSDDEELEIENWDNWTGENCSGNYYEEQIGPHCEEPDFNMDADYDPELDFQREILNSCRGKKRKKSKFASALLKKKPVFDPNSKAFEQYFDEYYKLDFEDIIGDMPVRFRYRQVVPNDFGLSVDEMLTANDKELNKWCSLKKTCQYRTEQEEMYDVQAFRKKANNMNKKRQILSSVYETTNIRNDELDTNEIREDLSSEENISSAKKLKNEKQQHKVNESQTTLDEHPPDKVIKKKKKMKKSQAIINMSNDEEILLKGSDDMNSNAEERPNTSNKTQDTIENSISDIATEIRKKKKKKKKKPVLNDTNIQKDKGMISTENSLNITSDSKYQSHFKIISSEDSTKSSSIKQMPKFQNKVQMKKNKFVPSQLYKTYQNSENPKSVQFSQHKQDKKNNKNRKVKDLESTDKRLCLSDERLQSYGINPKKYKNRLKYSQNIK